ncbi:phosphoribosylanthranilate isomerase [Clostridium sp. SHJSY1]|uniref:phosphoribosylanthranilate isomerase n=1 Tax=Clostridium sp. SHJSY1 TaxID=2942483 RepID=UPI0028753216|nr:phosphoribosylanthranilate isomerase [Clostridium sp. SHJSY1]MDS0524476.1 phosphoribosylanthranilate isomerase [Clostridium sp. SHJSY1]
MKIKICGITSTKEIEFLNKFKPDYIGLVFTESKRLINKEQGKLLYDLVDKKIKVVGVFRNNSLQYIEDILDVVPLDVVQLHGDEDEIFITKIRKIFNGEIWKAVSVKSKDDINDFYKYKVDSLLFDGTKPGEGKIFLWKYLDEISADKKFFLAGGIDEENVLKAIEEVNPYGIDISTSVESIIDGKRIKDELKVKRLIDKVRERHEGKI